MPAMHPSKILLWQISHAKPISQLQVIIQRIPMIVLSWESLRLCSNKILPLNMERQLLLENIMRLARSTLEKTKMK